MSKLNAKCIPIILMLLAVVFNANSQELLKISGNVQDSEGPLPGVNVIVSGTQFGTTTNFDGYFELDNVSSNATISFSYVGYVTQTISVNSRSTINVTLEADTNLLDEIVVIGYQSVKRSDIVGSVAIVDTEEMLKAPTGNAGAMLQGRAPGVTVTTSGGPGSGANVKIRGINSFSGFQVNSFIFGLTFLALSGPIAAISRLSP